MAGAGKSTAGRRPCQASLRGVPQAGGTQSPGTGAARPLGAARRRWRGPWRGPGCVSRLSWVLLSAPRRAAGSPGRAGGCAVPARFLRGSRAWHGERLCGGDRVTPRGFAGSQQQGGSIPVEGERPFAGPKTNKALGSSFSRQRHRPRRDPELSGLLLRSRGVGTLSGAR